jgi:hypothetical protein
MNKQIKNGLPEISRRGVVKGAAGVTIAFAMSGSPLGRMSEAFAAEGAKLNAWVTIGTDNVVTILFFARRRKWGRGC